MRFLTGTAMSLIVAAAAGAFAPTNAAAQQEPAATQDDDEITVTARRRDEQLQDVPIAVTALSGADLEEANVTRLENIEALTPGLSITPAQTRSGTLGFALRGQRQDAAFLTNDPSVGIYIAEAVQSRTFGLAQSLFDLQSVQVVKGPQGTLFGRNTTGGAILFQPNTPILGETSGYVRGIAGNYERGDVLAVLNLPLGEQAGLRIAASQTSREGYVHDVIRDIHGNAEETFSARVVFLLEPTDTFRNTLYIDYFDSDQIGSMTRLTAVNPANAQATARLVTSGIFANQTANYDFYEVGGNYGPRSAGDNVGLINVAEVDLSSNVTLKLIGQARSINMMELTDYDGTEAQVLQLFQTQSVDQFSGEVQLQGTAFDDRLNWVAGYFYFTEDGMLDTRTAANGAAPNPRLGYATNTSESVYAQGDFALTERLGLTLGARYTMDDRDFEQQLYSATTGLCTLCLGLSTEFDALTYTAGLNFSIDDDRMVYLVTRRGYRAGGFNSSGNTASALEPFDPEYVTDYEIGLKADWSVGDARARANIAVYHSEYEDIQRTAVRPVAGVPVTAIFNAAEATVDGAEIEFTLHPSDSLELIATAAYTKPEYTEFIEQTAGGPVDRSGNTFAYIPERTYRVGARWTLPFMNTNGSEVVASTDYYWRDEQYQAEFNSVNNYHPAYGLWSARLDFERVFGTGVNFALWGRNLAGEEYFSATGDLYASSGIVYRVPGEPRMYGIELSADF
ncbi:hypothetical protein U91I_01396 [alpha proteobacterium U9-1i]|nr:hypothetical protein U91I_01396 [alpha proteobacterium U9-1i]